MTLPSVDIIICKTATMVSVRDYSIAVKNQIYFELSYTSMLMDSKTRKDTLALANLFYTRGKLNVKYKFFFFLKTLLTIHIYFRI